MLEQIDRFLAEHARRWTPSTIERYRWYLLNLAKWLEGQGIGVPEKADLVRWVDARMRWGSSTQYTGMIACRSFYRWLLGREKSPAEGLPLPRRVYRPQRVLDEAKIMRVLSSLDTSTEKGRRDTAVILLMLDTGLRASEVCRLRLEHVDLAERRLTVRIKGGRWAEGVFCAYTSACLAEWIMDRGRIAKGDCAEIFCGIGGGTPGKTMTPSGLRCIFRQVGARAGFHFSPHDMRRTFATLALKGGASSRLVQVAGRWSSLAQVEHYSASLTAADFDPYSPVAKIMGLRVDQGRG
jgi:site-specific recombinase XerC